MSCMKIRRSEYRFTKTRHNWCEWKILCVKRLCSSGCRFLELDLFSHPTCGLHSSRRRNTQEERHQPQLLFASTLRYRTSISSPQTISFIIKMIARILAIFALFASTASAFVPAATSAGTYTMIFVWWGNNNPTGCCWLGGSLNSIMLFTLLVFVIHLCNFWWREISLPCCSKSCMKCLRLIWFNTVSQMRSNLPPPVLSVLWMKLVSSFDSLWSCKVLQCTINGHANTRN